MLLAYAVSLLGLNLLLGPGLFARFARSHGYVRCPARDHIIGRGRGKVLLDDYVLNGSDCRAGRPRTP